MFGEYNLETNTIKCVSPYNNEFTITTIITEGRFEPYVTPEVDPNLPTNTVPNTINTTGNTNITNEIPSTNEYSLRKYILGEDETGRDLSEIADFSEGIMFIADPENESETIYQNVKYGYGFLEDNIDDDGYLYGYIRYNKEIYKLGINPYNLKTNYLRLINTLEGHLGEYVTYNGLEYIVMAENDDTVDLISANAIGNVSLGYDDSIIDWTDQTVIKKADLDNEGEEGYGKLNSFEKAVYSYNNAITSLVIACKQIIGLEIDGTNVISVRCVGNKNVIYTSSGIEGIDEPGYVSSEYLNTKNDVSMDWFDTCGYDLCKIKKSDNYYDEDKTTMEELAIITSDNLIDYWLASREFNIADTDDFINFYIRYFDEIGDIVEDHLFNIQNHGDNSYDNECYGIALRPIVTVRASELGW